MPTDQLSDSELRTLVISILDREPDATFTRVEAHLRSLQGRPLEGAERDQLHDAYETELAHPTGAHRIGAVEAADLVRRRPFALRPTEIAGLVAGLLPLVVHLQTTTPSVTRGAGQVVAGGVYDPVAIAGGFLAILLGLIAARQAMHSGQRRALHFALVGFILLLGVYQSLLGLGLLHKLGLFSAA